jgi:hypothetical protein
MPSIEQATFIHPYINKKETHHAPVDTQEKHG